MNICKISAKLFLFVVMVMGVSCKKQLDENLKKVFTPDNYFSSEQDAINAVNAAYPIFADNLLYGQELRFILEFGNDEVLSAPDVTVSNWIQENYTMNPTNLDRVRLVWGRLWEIVKNTNFVIDGVTVMDTTKVSGAVIRRVTGEARFLRALAYFHLTQIWGDLPLLDKFPRSVEQSTSVAKTPAAGIRDFIREDLTSAIADLPYKKDYSAADLGRATKGAAQALLMKMQLWDGDWQGAVTTAEQIMADPSGYALNPAMEKNFQAANENGMESLFEIQYSKSIAGNHLGEDYAAYPPTQKLVNAYEPTDLRKGLYISNISYRPSLPGDRYYFSKYGYDPTEEYTSFNQGVNFVVLRFSDVVLMYAEALNELNRTPEAVIQINKIRDRAHATPIPDGISVADFRTALRKERMLELCGECWRRFDLVRWGILIPTVQAMAGENPMGAANITDRNVLYPIPAEEISLNPNLNPNNGY